MESKDKDAGWNLGWGLLVIVIVAALVVCFLFLLFFWTEWSPARTGTGELGQMGDFFGGMLNPLVSAVTLYVAIRVWQLQKVELQATKNALDEQAKTAEQQRQEQRFFDLLNVYQRTVDSIYHATDVSRLQQNTRTLLSATGKFGVSLWLSDASCLRLYATGDTIIDTQSAKRDWISRDSPGSFDHYFRVVFRILSEAEALLGDQHIRYIELFHAQLSRSELIILAYNLWLDDEGKKMIPLAEKYGLLKHLPTGPLRTELEKLHPQVFGHTRAHSLQALPQSQPEASL